LYIHEGMWARDLGQLILKIGTTCSGGSHGRPIYARGQRPLVPFH